MVSPYAADQKTAAGHQGTTTVIPVTNAIEALNSSLRRAVKIRGHFPTDEAAMKLIFLVLRDVAKDWKMPTREWTEAKSQFAILFEERFKIA